jgi:ribonuclease HII
MLNKCYSNFTIECGTDEAGRGCLAGPVTAAAIILQSPNIKLTKEQKKQEQLLFQAINDSKQLSEKKRFELRPIIESLFDFSYTHIYNVEIDEINILNASMKAMQESVLKLKTIPEYIIVDGNRPLNGKLGMKQMEGKIFNAKEIEILDVNGKLVESFGVNSKIETFGVGHLANGLYFYTVKDKNAAVLSSGKITVKH